MSVTKNCLNCYKVLPEGVVGFHPSCSRKFFGKPEPPELPYTESQMYELADKVIRSQSVITGVQPKLSLELQKGEKAKARQRFTIVGLWGNYILKPPTEMYVQLPEIEDVTMHLAEESGIETVPHSLIRLQSGSLAYITKRIDRVKGEKLHMEDMCQLTERLTEHKYHGSYEQIGKAILKYSANPGLDAVNFFEQVIFSFLTGNADMHLKNFSLIKHPQTGYVLAPAYDMVASALIVKGDTEELALTLNGKKKNLLKKDFTAAMESIEIPKKSGSNIFKKFSKSIPKWDKLLEQSFLSVEMKKNYTALIEERRVVLDL